MFVLLEGRKYMSKNPLMHVGRPQEIQMLVRSHTRGHRGFRQTGKHDVDIDQTIAAPIDEHGGRLDIPRGILGGLVEALAGIDGKRDVDLIVEELERSIADDLEPVHDGLGAGEGVEMRVGGQLLGPGDVLAAPVEEDEQRHVDELGEDGRVEDGLPHGRGAEDASSTEEQVQEVRGRLHQGIHRGVGKTGGRHGRSQSDEQIHFLVEIGMDRQRRKRLRRPLREPNVGQARLPRHLEDILDAIGDIVERKLVNGEVPEFIVQRRIPHRLLGILVAPVIAQPDIVATFDQLER